MSNPQIPETKPSPPSNPPKIPDAGGGYTHGPHYPNPPESTNPDAATLRDQWRFSTRQYSKWYSHAWGTAILAGASFFALGWIIKGSNPIPSFRHDNTNEDISSSTSSGDRDKDKAAAEIHQPR